MSARLCPHCGQEHAPGARFCPTTGKAIRADQATGLILVGSCAVLIVLIGVTLLASDGRILTSLRLSGGPSDGLGGGVAGTLAAELAQGPGGTSPNESFANGIVSGATSRVAVTQGLEGQDQAASSTSKVDATATAGASGQTARDTLSPPPETRVAPSSEAREVCADAPRSRLAIGMRAYVSFVPALSNRVRSSAGTQGRIVGYIDPGEEISILEGPTCDNGWVWWKIRSSESGLTGWTAEGDQSDYWLVPME
jgi:hypothetical protein